MAIAVGVVLAILDLEALSFGASGAVALLHLFMVPGLGLGLLYWGIRGQRRTTRRMGAALVLAAVASLVVSGIVLRHKLADSKASGDAVCLALEAYRNSAGRYPHRLQELVPAFLPAVPATSMGVFSTMGFRYQPSLEGQDYTLGFTSTAFIFCERGRAAGWRCDD